MSVNRNDAREWLSIAEDGIEAATVLADGQFHRACVSRAYFCMYHAAHALVLQHGMTPPAEGNWSHAGLREAISSPLLKTRMRREVIKILQALGRTFNARCDADYRPQCKIRQEDARQSLREAGFLIEKARRAIRA